jgi:16S rRNA processing protein RimM
MTVDEKSPVIPACRQAGFMQEKVLTEIGFIRKTQGFNGRVILAVNSGNAEDFFNGNYLFLDMDGSMVPFYVEDFSAEGTQAVITFEDVNTHEAAAALVSKKVFLPNDELPAGFNEQDELKTIVGFTIIDDNRGILGSVKDIAETPGQLMIFFDYANAEVMLPVNDQTLLKIVKKKKEIHVRLPEGLLEIYTGSGKK